MRRVLEKQGARTVLEPAGIVLDDIVKAHRWGMARVQPGTHEPTERSFRCASWRPAVRLSLPDHVSVLGVPARAH